MSSTTSPVKMCHSSAIKRDAAAQCAMLLFGTYTIIAASSAVTVSSLRDHQLRCTELSYYANAAHEVAKQDKYLLLQGYEIATDHTGLLMTQQIVEH
jgi:hypothetical protein